MQGIRQVTERKKSNLFSMADLKQLATVSWTRCSSRNEWVTSRRFLCFSLQDIKINMEKFDDLLMKLNDHGFLLKKGANLYQASIID